MTLAEQLRAAGLAVTEHRAPGRPGSWAPSGVLLHHTAGAATGDAPSLGFALNGTAGLPGPLYQLLVARSGHVHLLSEGRANHAGAGSGLVSAGIPTDQGNARLWGIGVESPGRAMDWPEPQWRATHAAAAVLLARLGAGVERVWRHRDYTPRKIDTVYPLEQHRAAIRAALGDGAQPPAGEDDEMSGFTATDPDGQTWHFAGIWRRPISWDTANALATLAQPVPFRGAIGVEAMAGYAVAPE